MSRQWLERALSRSRDIPGLRGIRTLLRTTHIIAFSTLYGGHVYGLGAERLFPALVATVLTGGAFAALEILHAPVWVVQLRGVATVVKVLITASVPLWWDQRVAALTLVAVIGSVGSHMPGRFRYYSVLHGRQVGERESG